jgi:hypothetical protein
MEKVLIEQNQVAGLGRDNVCRYVRVCRALHAKSAQCISKFRMV